MGIAMSLPRDTVSLEDMRPRQNPNAADWSAGDESFPTMVQAAGRCSAKGHVFAILQTVPIFAALDTAQLLHLSALLRQVTVARGTLVTLEGHTVDALYIVASGSFKRFRTSATGREQILALLGQGDTFGEVPLLDGSEDFASTQAMRHGLLLVLPGAEFNALLNDASTSLSGLHHSLTGRIRDLARVIDDLSFCHVLQRVARLILDQPHSTDRPYLTQATMAAMTGTTREVVARTVHELNKRGAITVRHGRITVRDAALLRQIAGSDR